jgi:hypothetical protein
MECERRATGEEARYVDYTDAMEMKVGESCAEERGNSELLLKLLTMLGKTAKAQVAQNSGTAGSTLWPLVITKHEPFCWSPWAAQPLGR